MKMFSSKLICIIKVNFPPLLQRRNIMYGAEGWRCIISAARPFAGLTILG
jgi:hypothetical protein